MSPGVHASIRGGRERKQQYCIRFRSQIQGDRFGARTLKYLVSRSSFRGPLQCCKHLVWEKPEGFRKSRTWSLFRAKGKLDLGAQEVGALPFLIKIAGGHQLFSRRPTVLHTSRLVNRGNSAIRRHGAFFGQRRNLTWGRKR